MLPDEIFCYIFPDNQMDVHIRIWDSVKSRVNTPSLTANFMKSPNTDNFLELLLDNFYCMNGAKLIMLSMDGK